ncbi:MAG: peptidoglycan-binding protein [Coriobacteriia bacterium]|nr:peptidoglycan-binding protein [Coriobacteriia bacterium]MBN2822020.1 peptidoglycan-binding protein [Coriobacteriia bacterium]
MIEPIKRGARGPAVEDIQKRLLMLGYDLGPTGIDGVFLGATWDAVHAFQSERALAEDGVVGNETWSSLVDATFRLGDRLLYLKFPYFHGQDVRLLQGAMNALGFACGNPDGIFGAFTERAVREFQSNIAQPGDGIVGAETVRAIERLRHVWHDKDPSAPVALKVAPARAADLLARRPVALLGLDEIGNDVAARVANLAIATEPSAVVAVDDDSMSDVAMIIRLGSGIATQVGGACPRLVVESVEDSALEPRLLTALSAVEGSREVVIDFVPELLGDDAARQRVAVRMLDAVCSALSREGEMW